MKRYDIEFQMLCDGSWQASSVLCRFRWLWLARFAKRYWAPDGWKHRIVRVSADGSREVVQ